MSEFVTSEIGVYLMSLVFGIGVGLLLEAESRRTWAGALLVTAVFVALLATSLPRAVWAVPIFVVALGVTALLSTVARFGSSPLLVSEPYWRKVVLTFVHGRRIRSAARAECEEESRQQV